MQDYPYNVMPMYQPQGYRYQQPPAMHPQANVDWVQVAGYEAAKAQQVEPGKTCWMRDTSEPYIYAKAVDMMGTPYVQMFRVERVNPEEISPSAKIISREDLDGLEKRLSAVEDVLRAAAAQPATKRAARKAEEDHE